MIAWELALRRRRPLSRKVICAEERDSVRTFSYSIRMAFNGRSDQAGSLWLLPLNPALPIAQARFCGGITQRGRQRGRFSGARCRLLGALLRRLPGTDAAVRSCLVVGAHRPLDLLGSEQPRAFAGRPLNRLKSRRQRPVRLENPGAGDPQLHPGTDLGDRRNAIFAQDFFPEIRIAQMRGGDVAHRLSLLDRDREGLIRPGARGR